MSDTNFESGAVRSAEAKDFSFTSLPWVGILGLARTGGEGATKYGRYNYMLGMPVHDLLEHVLKHQAMFILGDRSEPHLEHAAWGLLAAIQSYALDPALSAPHLLGPGATMTPEVVAFLDANKADLAEKRAAGVFSGIGGWDLRDIPEVARLLAQRESAQSLAVELESNASDASYRKLQLQTLDIKGVTEGWHRTDREEFLLSGKHPEVTEPAKVKRPRRTKSQIAADKAADEAANSVRFDDSDTVSSYTGLVPTVLMEGAILATNHKITPASEGGDHMGGCPQLP